MLEDKNFRILSLSGGGFLGLYTISVIEKIEENLGKPIAQCFDLLAGTSIGGIIALALAAEVPARDIRKAFESNGSKIFSDRPKPKGLKKLLDMRRYCRSAKYSSKALRETIESIVGADTKIGDLKHAVIVPAVNLTNGSTQFFKTPHHPTFKRDLHLKVVDVALATSAAPTYFPLAEIGNELFADGGLYSNTPDLAALHEAEFFFKFEQRQVGMLSIGTTTSKFSLTHKDGKNFGILQWLSDERLARIAMSSQQIYSNFVIKHKLGERYLKIDHEQSDEQGRDLGLDVATAEATKTILGISEGTYRKYVNDEVLKKMLSYQKSPTVFYNPQNEQPHQI